MRVIDRGLWALRALAIGLGGAIVELAIILWVPPSALPLIPIAWLRFRTFLSVGWWGSSCSSD